MKPIKTRMLDDGYVEFFTDESMALVDPSKSEIVSIKVWGPWRKGLGSQLLEAIIEQFGDVIVKPDAYDRSEQQNVLAFYRKNGFVPLDEGSEYLIYQE